MLLLIITKLRRKESIDVFQCKYIIQVNMDKIRLIGTCECLDSEMIDSHMSNLLKVER